MISRMIEAQVELCRSAIPAFPYDLVLTFSGEDNEADFVFSISVVEQFLKFNCLLNAVEVFVCVYSRSK